MFQAATKLTVVTEAFVTNDVCRIIEECGGRGYPLVHVGGTGAHGLHSMQSKATVAEGFDNVKVETIIAARTIIDEISHRIMTECLNDKPGIIYLEPVEVCRSERF